MGIPRVQLCTELFYAIVPTLFLCFFGDLLSLHLTTFEMFLFLLYLGLNSEMIPLKCIYPSQ